MIRISRVIVHVSCATPYRDLAELGVEFARVFQTRVQGRVFDQPHIFDLAEFPSLFMPASMQRSVMAGSRGLQSSMVGARRMLTSDFERVASLNQVDVEVVNELEREEIPKGSDAAIMVLPLDLSRSDLGALIKDALAVMPKEGAMLLVPERRPSRTGSIVSLSNALGSQAVAIASHVSARLVCPTVHYTLQSNDVAHDRDMPPQERHQQLSLKSGAMIDADLICLSAVRLFVTSIRHLANLDCTGPASPIRRYRAPLLIVDDAEVT